eukprot:jgi/Bigna1/141242/aug1.61_g15950
MMEKEKEQQEKEEGGEGDETTWMRKLRKWAESTNKKASSSSRRRRRKRGGKKQQQQEIIVKKEGQAHEDQEEKSQQCSNTATDSNDGSLKQEQTTRKLQKIHQAILKRHRNFACRSVVSHLEIPEEALDPDFKPELNGLLPRKAQVEICDLAQLLDCQDSKLLGPMCFLVVMVN